MSETHDGTSLPEGISEELATELRDAGLDPSDMTVTMPDSDGSDDDDAPAASGDDDTQGADGTQGDSEGDAAQDGDAADAGADTDGDAADADAGAGDDGGGGEDPYAGLPQAARERLERSEATQRRLQSERDTARSRAEAAETQVRERAVAEQTAARERLANMSEAELGRHFKGVLNQPKTPEQQVQEALGGLLSRGMGDQSLGFDTTESAEAAFAEVNSIDEYNAVVLERGRALARAELEAANASAAAERMAAQNGRTPPSTNGAAGRTPVTAASLATRIADPNDDFGDRDEDLEAYEKVRLEEAASR